MASERAIYWMAVGVVALLLGQHFVSRYDARCLANRSLAAVQQLSGWTDRLMAMAESTLGRTAPQFLSTEAELAGIQTRFASLDSAIARQQAACARLQAEQARRMALQQVQQMRLEVICPRQRLRAVHLPATPDDGTI